MNENEVRISRLLLSKWLIPAYVFLCISIIILILEALGIMRDVGIIGVIIAMNLFTVSFLAGVFIPVLTQIYGKINEISGKLP